MQPRFDRDLVIGLSWIIVPYGLILFFINMFLPDASSLLNGLILLAAAVSTGGWYTRVRNTISSETLSRMLDKLGSFDFDEAVQIASEETGISDTSRGKLVRFAQAMTDTLEALGRHRHKLEQIGVQLTGLSELLNSSRGSTESMHGSVEQSVGFHRGVAESVDGLARTAEGTSSSVLEMVAINNEVTDNIHNLASSVEQTTSAIEEMTFSVKEVAKNIEELSMASEETAASMNEMDASIRQVENNAEETTRLSEEVTQNAESGVSAINQTIQGIDRIKDSSRVAAEVITTLGERIGAIGNILNVIDDVAEQTNLLALNAAIIAAQAGEHGRGFAVVADEIKALAERTGSSTKEIAELVNTIQDESRNAITVMAKGVTDVEDGVRLGHNAEDALRQIVESAKRSTVMIRAIAQSTIEQAKGSNQVTDAISRIAETVQQIARATSEQAKGSEQIMKSAERMRIITQQVERSTEEQNRGGQQVTNALENIRDIVESINRRQSEQLTIDGKLNDLSELVLKGNEDGWAICEEIIQELNKSSSQFDELRTN